MCVRSSAQLGIWKLLFQPKMMRQNYTITLEIFKTPMGIQTVDKKPLRSPVGGGSVSFVKGHTHWPKSEIEQFCGLMKARLLFWGTADSLSEEKYAAIMLWGCFSFCRAAILAYQEPWISLNTVHQNIWRGNGSSCWRRKQWVQPHLSADPIPKP